ncbi:MAG: BamA/TamA family outer membrane protein [Methylobacter sp.]|nr:BamA/TamA family outer membrane protein [Methylobacter sp.]
MKLEYLLAAGLLWAGGIAVAADSAKSQLVPVAESAPPKNPAFNIFDFQVNGNTVLDEETLERSVYPFLGPDKTVDDVEKARAALEEAYRKKGYPTVVVSIPEQDVNADQVRLDVLEGSIETLHITGSRYYELGKIRDSVPALAEGQVPNMPEVQKQMGVLAQQSADRNVTPVLRAGTTPGKMEVELKVKDELPLHASVEMNSRSSANTSYTRLIGSVRYDNLWQKFHSASLQYQVSPENNNEVEVWSGTYVLPTGWADTKLALYGIGISSNTQLGVNVGGMSVVGAGSIYGARLVKPLPGSDDFLQSVTAGFDYKSFGQGIKVSGQDSSPSSISYASFMTGYDGSWRKEASTTSLNLAAHFSIRGLGNDEQEFISKRSDASPNFLYLTTDLKHQQILPMDFRVLGRAGGQASMSALISNEQFSAGGPQSVRGYHQTELLGDHGVNLSFELHTPKLGPSDWEKVQNLRLLTFVDWANLWTFNPIAPTPGSTNLASAGMGVRLQMLKHIIGEFDWAYPLVKQGTVDVGAQRVDFRMLYEF